MSDGEGLWGFPGGLWSVAREAFQGCEGVVWSQLSDGCRLLLLPYCVWMGSQARRIWCHGELMKTFCIKGLWAGFAVVLCVACDGGSAPVGDGQVPPAASPTGLSNFKAWDTCLKTIKTVYATPSPARPANPLAPCASLFQQQPCREAIATNHDGIWDACTNAYCPLFEKASQRLDHCADPKTRDLVVRAEFINVILSKEHNLTPMPQRHIKSLKKALSAPVEDRQRRMAEFTIALTQDPQLTERQRQAWSLALSLAR